METAAVGIELNSVQAGVGVEQMLEHFPQCDLGESGASVANGLEINGVDGRYQLGLEGAVNVVVFLPMSEFFGVDTDSVCDGLGVTNSDGMVARVAWKDEWVARGHQVVQRSRQDNAHVAMCAASTGGGCFGCIGAQCIASGLEAGIGWWVGDRRNGDLKPREEIVGGGDRHGGERNKN